MCACAGAEGRGFGLKRPDKESEALQLHQYPSVHLPREWTRPRDRLYADILAATANMVFSQGRSRPFSVKSRPDLSDNVGRWRQNERCQRVKNTWYGPPLGGLRPLKQGGPSLQSLGPKRQAREAPVVCACAGAEGVPAQGMRVEVSA